jgi:hypothetical protein
LIRLNLRKSLNADQMRKRAPRHTQSQNRPCARPQALSALRRNTHKSLDRTDSDAVSTGANDSFTIVHV